MIDLQSTKIFLDKVFLELLRSEIDVSYYELDHICYRVETMKEYEENKQYLSEIGELLKENIISGRPIAVYKLNNAIVYQNRKVFIFELPAPKDGRYYKTGFEHVEFVIDEKFEDFMVKHSKLEFETQALSKKINPDISLKLGDISVKFHRKPLEYIIEFEQS